MNQNNKQVLHDLRLGKESLFEEATFNQKGKKLLPGRGLISLDCIAIVTVHTSFRMGQI